MAIAAIAASGTGFQSIRSGVVIEYEALAVRINRVKNLKPFFTFYGGKYRAAPNYPKPLFSTIIEPFAGSAGYSVRNHTRNVLLYDADPIIVGVWDFLIRATKEEILSLPLDISKGVDHFNICQEAKWLIGFWLNKGSTGPRKTPSKWMRDGLRPNSQWGRVIRTRIACQVRYIRHWKIEQRDYSEVENKKAVWYIDPPYIGKSGSLYRKKVDSYAALASWCHHRSGQLIVCEQLGANWMKFIPFRKCKALEGRRGSKTINEVVFLR